MDNLVADCDQKTDSELVRLTLGNQIFFQCLMKRYEESLKRYIRRISGFSETEAEDILQEVYIKTFLNLNDYDKSLKFSSWIYRITHNEVISQYRKIKARPQGNSIKVDEGWLNNLPGELDLQEEIENRFDIEKVRQALNKIRIKYREVIILRFLEEKSYKEISDIIKKPEGTVATLLNRAKKHLAEQIKKG